MEWDIYIDDDYDCDNEIMPWYSVYRADKVFEEFYRKKPHLEKRHKKYFKEECDDHYLWLANDFHPGDFEEWVSSLGKKKLCKYEKSLYAKVDRYTDYCIDVIIISYYVLDQSPVMCMRFIYDIPSESMYHYRIKNFRNIAYVLNTCSESYHMGGWTDFDKFYSQNQRFLDEKSVKILKSLEQFKYLPIEKFKKINVYLLFQASEQMIYQYEILLKMGCHGLASDLLLEREFINPNSFKKFKKQIMSGIRWKRLKEIIFNFEHQERLRQQKIQRNMMQKIFAEMPKQCYDLGKFILRHPINFKELEQEGRELRHCVVDYLESIVKGKTDIYFLRKKEEPDKPFYTVEIKDNQVIQCRTLKNQANPEITKLVSEYLERIIS